MTLGNAAGKPKNEEHTIHFSRDRRCLRLFKQLITHYELLLKQVGHESPLPAFPRFSVFTVDLVKDTERKNTVVSHL